MPENFPNDFLQRIRDQFGPEADKFISGLSSTPTIAIRQHPLKKTDAPKNSSSIPWCENGFYLESRPSFTLDPLFHAGAYYVQEPSSMFLDFVLRKISNPDQQPNVLDLCAAPGGKSTLIASWLNGQGFLVSNEVIRPRAAILEENTIKWGYANVCVTQNDPSDFARLPDFFDIIVIDAPCSGEGLFRKDETAADEWSLQNCQLCEGRQRRIVEDVLPALRPGGFLIYSTCTYNPGENDENVKWMSEEFGLKVIEPDVDADWGIEKTGAGGFAFYPYKVKGEGFYIACLQKTANDGPINFSYRERKPKRFSWQKIPREWDGIPEKYLADPGSFFIHRQGQFFTAIPSHLKEEMEHCFQSLYIKYAGLQLGEPKGKDFIPSHALSVSVSRSESLPTYDVQLKTALQFLRKDMIVVPPEVPKGWILISYRNQPLGWIKNLGNRVNNYYPQNWRIKMELPDQF